MYWKRWYFIMECIGCIDATKASQFNVFIIGFIGGIAVVKAAQIYAFTMQFIGKNYEEIEW